MPLFHCLRHHLLWLKNVLNNHKVILNLGLLCEKISPIMENQMDDTLDYQDGPRSRNHYSGPWAGGPVSELRFPSSGSVSLLGNCIPREPF